MNDTFTLARIIANEIDSEMHRKGYEQGIRDGAQKAIQECIDIIDRHGGSKEIIAAMKKKVQE